MSLKFCLHYGSMYENERNKNEKKKKKTTKNCSKIHVWRTGIFPQKLALIRLTVSEKMGSTDRPWGDTGDAQRTTDARTMTAALLCSSAKQSYKRKWKI